MLCAAFKLISPNYLFSSLHVNTENSCGRNMQHIYTHESASKPRSYLNSEE